MPPRTNEVDMADIEDEKKELEASVEINNLLSFCKDLAQPFNYNAVTKLDLFGSDLSALPSSLPELLPNLSIMFCAKNKFTEIPALIGWCKNLQVRATNYVHGLHWEQEKPVISLLESSLPSFLPQMVSFKSNQIECIHPEALRPQMRWLILTDNKLEFFPWTIGRCEILQKLMLSGNRLKAIPDEISYCKNLELVRLASNQLEQVSSDRHGRRNGDYVAKII